MLLMPCPYNTDEKSPQAASSLPKFTRKGHGPVKGPVPQIALKAGAGSQGAVHPDNTCCCGHKGLSAAGNEGPVPGEPGEACTPQDSPCGSEGCSDRQPIWLSVWSSIPGSTCPNILRAKRSRGGRLATATPSSPQCHLKHVSPASLGQCQFGESQRHLLPQPLPSPSRSLLRPPLPPGVLWQDLKGPMTLPKNFRLLLSL